MPPYRNQPTNLHYKSVDWFLCDDNSGFKSINLVSLLLLWPCICLFGCSYIHNAVFFQPATLLKKRLWYRCFPVNFAQFLRTPFLQNSSGRLFLPSGKLLLEGPCFDKVAGESAAALRKNNSFTGVLL